MGKRRLFLINFLSIPNVNKALTNLRMPLGKEGLTPDFSGCDNLVEVKCVAN